MTLSVEAIPRPALICSIAGPMWHAHIQDLANPYQRPVHRMSMDDLLAVVSKPDGIAVCLNFETYLAGVICVGLW